MSDDITIHVFTPGSLPDEEAWLLLNHSERTRADRFKFERDARHWTQCRAALRCVLGEAKGLDPGKVAIHEGPFGKPEVPGGPYFNLSHCADLALIALRAGAPVGVDIEPLGRASSLEGCEETFCHPREISGLPEAASDRNLLLLRIWAAKEAFLKALGTGLSQPPQEVRVDLRTGKAGSERPLAGLDELVLHELSVPGSKHHVAMLATPPFSGRIRWVEGVLRWEVTRRTMDRI